jgi:hypothetical protein
MRGDRPGKTGLEIFVAGVPAAHHKGVDKENAVNPLRHSRMMIADKLQQHTFTLLQGRFERR